MITVAGGQETAHVDGDRGPGQVTVMSIFVSWEEPIGAPLVTKTMVVDPAGLPRL